MKTAGWVAVITATLLGLGGCGVAGEIEDATNAISNAIEDDGASGDEPAAGGEDSLSSLLDASANEDVFIEYRIGEDTPSLWFVQVNTASSGPVAISVILDPSGMHNFTVAPTGSDSIQSPLTELSGSLGFTPGVIATPGPTGTKYTWSNGPSSWTVEADSQDRAVFYRVETPEGDFEMDFLYGSDISNKLSQSFIDGVVAELDASGSEFLFGATADDFATWEIYEF